MSSPIGAGDSSISAQLRPLRPEFIDGIADALVSAPDQLCRGRVVAELMAEIYETVAWLYSDATEDELVSLRRWRDDAAAYCQRIASIDNQQLDVERGARQTSRSPFRRTALDARKVAGDGGIDPDHEHAGDPDK